MNRLEVSRIADFVISIKRLIKSIPTGLRTLRNLVTNKKNPRKNAAPNIQSCVLCIFIPGIRLTRNGHPYAYRQRSFGLC